VDDTADPWTAKLRTAAQATGKTYYALSKESGVGMTAMRSFFVDGRPLSVANAAKLAAVVGLELRERRKRA